MWQPRRDFKITIQILIQKQPISDLRAAPRLETFLCQQHPYFATSSAPQKIHHGQNRAQCGSRNAGLASACSEPPTIKPTGTTVAPPPPPTTTTTAATNSKSPTVAQPTPTARDENARLVCGLLRRD
jgi:hypothetical protein